MRLTHKLRRFLALSRVVRRRFLVLVITLPLTALVLRRWGLRRTQTILLGAGKLRTATEESVEEGIQSSLQALQLLVRNSPYRGNCLSQSLALWWLLRRQGIDSDLRIGTRKQEGHFRAHAWIEREGVVLNDVADVHARFTAFDDLHDGPAYKAGRKSQI